MDMMAYRQKRPQNLLFNHHKRKLDTDRLFCIQHMTIYSGQRGIYRFSSYHHTTRMGN
uniref:Uncharacterized protein n=1 Tax=Lutzomyia longipalpis TaxID=7200 RepID=A0A1B0CAV2_LUTLO